MRTKPTSPVRIEAVKASTRRVDPANQYHKTNVNVAQGPRTGNPGARPGKRDTFLDDKADAAPLAKVIQDAYVRRAHEYKDFEYTNGGSIHDNTRVRVKNSRKF
jgi:hypothetical protein